MPPSADEILKRVQDYRQTFKGVVPHRVLADLARFCRAYKTTHVSGDPYGSAQLEGRRQVWLRIQEHLNADEAKVRRVLEQDETE